VGTSEGAKKGATEEARQKRREAMQRKWQDPEYRAKRAALEATPEMKAARSAGAQVANSDPERRQRHSEIMQQKFAEDAEFRERQSAGMRRVNRDDPTINQARSESMKRAWKENPEAFINSVEAVRAESRSPSGRRRRQQFGIKLAARNAITAYEMEVIHTLNQLNVCYQVHYETDYWELDIRIPSLNLEIEVDGPEHNTPARQQKDRRRDAALKHDGYKILRITHKEIDNGTFLPKLQQALGLLQGRE
jgi:very-short-patch-repair endonuclease